MAANHVAARFAFNDGVDVATAVASRSLVTALVVAVIVVLTGAPRVVAPRQRRMLLGIGLLLAVQSLCLYSSVARLPVALALLAFNSYPLWAALADRVVYGRSPPRLVLVVMPVILVGLALALDVAGAASGLGAGGQWARIGTGVAFALGAATTFGLAMVVTQHEVAALDGRLRTAITMGIVGVMALAAVAAQGGPKLPASAAGWWGLALLTLLYGSGFTVMFTVLPRLGVAGSSPVMNVEPIFALVFAWVLLDQRIAPMQLVGAAIVVGGVTVLGLRRR